MTPFWIWYGCIVLFVVFALVLLVVKEARDEEQTIKRKPPPPPRMIALPSKGTFHVIEFANDAELADTVRLLAKRQEKTLIEN